MYRQILLIHTSDNWFPHIIALHHFLFKSTCTIHFYRHSSVEYEKSFFLRGNTFTAKFMLHVTSMFTLFLFFIFYFLLVYNHYIYNIYIYIAFCVPLLRRSSTSVYPMIVYGTRQPCLSPLDVLVLGVQSSLLPLLLWPQLLAVLLSPGRFYHHT